MAVQAQSLVPEEADVIARVAGLPVDLAAMAVAANVWRAAQAVRGRLERTVLRAEGLSWAGFSALFNLWVWDAMETRALARSMGVARPTVSGVIDTLQARGLVQRTGDARDRRLCRVALTAAGRETIEELFPRFNRGEAAVTGGLTDEERATLAALLRRVIAAAKEDA